MRDGQVDDLYGPRRGHVHVFALTGGSQEVDLRDAAVTPQVGGVSVFEGLFVELNAPVDCVYYWHSATGGTVDDTAVTGNNRAARLWAKTPKQMVCSGRFLVIKGTAASLVSLELWNKPDGE